MDFDFTDEQLALRDAVRGLLATTYSTVEGRLAATGAEPGFDETMWRKLAEMGVLELPFADDAGPVEVAVVATEMGRVAASEPFVEAIVLAGGLIAAAGGSTLGIADGSVLPAYAGGAGVTAREVARGWVLEGVKEPVLNGARADLLVVTADVEGATGLFTTTEGSREGYSTFDGGRAARVTFDESPAQLLAADVADLVAQAEAVARIAYAHESVGLMEQALSLTTEYLRTRKQFGVPLKAFQALTHRAADMYVALELARSLALWATLVQLEGGDVVDAGARAKLQASKAGRHIGKEAIQLHGGIGMTMEYAVGHHALRLTAIDHLLGDGREQLRRLAAGVGKYGALQPIP